MNTQLSYRCFSQKDKFMEITPTLATSALEGHSLQVLVCLLLIDAKSH